MDTKKLKKSTNDAIDMSGKALNDLMSTAEELSTKTRDVTAAATEKSLDFVKTYPIHTAIGAAAIGYLFGLLSSSRKR